MAEPLTVESIYMYEKENAKLHHTHNFELIHLDNPTPIFRRGQLFNLAVRFHRDYDDDNDVVRLIFNFGANPNVFHGTRGVGIVKSSADHDDSSLSQLQAWDVKMIGVNGTDLSIAVRSPVDSPVGLWQLNVETTVKDGDDTRNTYQYDNDIYLLFNPWLKEDLVYMEDETLLDEYILNDVGKIWVGPDGSTRGREWIFGQFDETVLPACMLLFEKSNIKPVNRGDPIKVSRMISKMVNCYNYENGEDVYNGVLFGSWEAPYDDGTAPAAWTGSVPILEQYLNSGGDYVKYGQCWVFAGVVTTICRALGLPSRVVTNLVSAHDTNSSLSIDRYFDADMNPLDTDPVNSVRSDSIWNFHVWNDVWMARPDLPIGYGGWQAIDGTPQETSDGLYRCGPASVEAIRNGVVGINYDIGFLVAAVNADVFDWKDDPNSIIGYSRINNGHRRLIGKMILTKAPWIFDPNGDQDRDDITYQYKAPEGTDDERLNLYRAVRSTPVAKRFYHGATPKNEDLDFKLVDLKRVNIGESFIIMVNIRNKSEEMRTVKAILWAGSVYYNGVKAKMVKKAHDNFILRSGEAKQLELRVTVEEYFEKLVEYSIMKINAIATVQETNQTWADEDDFQVIKPTIKIDIAEDLVVGQPVTISLSFRNPLKWKLTNCEFNYAGTGLCKNKTVKFRDIEPLEDVFVQHALTPHKSGSQKIVATFTSTQLVDVTGSASVEVLDE